MLITKDDLVETRFFGYESYFDHVIAAFDDLHRKDLFHRFDWMRQHLIFFTFVDDFEDALRVVGSVEAKLDVVFGCLKHDRND